MTGCSAGGAQTLSLGASWTPLAGLTPAQFNSYRSALGEGSGFQSAMYRRMEFLLGEKSASMLVPHQGAPRVHAELEKALQQAEPVRRGAAAAGAPRARDPGGGPGAGPRAAPRAVGRGRGGVDRAVPRVSRARSSLRLGEALTDVAELVWRWRDDHLVATRRTMGAKVGTGGSAGRGLAGEARFEERVPRAVDGAQPCLRRPSSRTSTRRPRWRSWDAADELGGLRERFLLDDVVYLDGNSLGALPERCRGASRTSFAASGASCASGPGTEPSGPMPVPGGEHPEAMRSASSRALQDAQALLEALADRYDVLTSVGDPCGSGVPRARASRRPRRGGRTGTPAATSSIALVPCPVTAKRSAVVAAS